MSQKFFYETMRGPIHNLFHLPKLCLCHSVYNFFFYIVQLDQDFVEIRLLKTMLVTCVDRNLLFVKILDH